MCCSDAPSIFTLCAAALSDFRRIPTALLPPTLVGVTRAVILADGGCIEAAHGWKLTNLHRHVYSCQEVAGNCKEKVTSPTNLLFFLPMRLLPLLLLGLLSLQTLHAGAVKRSLPMGTWPMTGQINFDLYLDGVMDLTGERYAGMTNGIPGSSWNGATVAPRQGMEFLVATAPGGRELLSLNLPATVQAAFAGGTWMADTAVLGTTLGFNLGGTYTSGDGTTYSGPFANRPYGWIGFRIQRQGRWYYGALQGGATQVRRSVPFISSGLGSSPSTGPQTELVTLPAESLRAIILESEPDTPVIVTAPLLRIERDTGLALEDGSATDFGEVGIGEITVRQFTVANTSAATLTGLNWTFEGPASPSFTLLDAPITELAAGASASFRIGFLPVQQGAYRTTLKISQGSTDPNPYLLNLIAGASEAETSLFLEEVGAGPAAQVIDFGSPAMGTTVKKTFRLVNASGRTFTGRVNLYNPNLGRILYLSGLSLYSTTTAPMPGFSLISPQRFTLRPGESRSFDIAWNPESTQRVQQTVQVTEDSTGSVKRSFQVVGAGTRGSVIQDHALFRFGDGQSLSIISGAPVAQELALHFGDEDVWDGQYPNHVIPAVVGYIMPDFVGRLAAGLSSAPTLLPLNIPGTAASLIGSRAALHFSVGDSLSDNSFGLGQHTNLGVQLWVRAEEVTGTHRLVHVGDPAGDGMGLWQVDGVIKGRLANGAWVGEAPVQVGVWQHLALVRQGITSTLYLNGQAVGPTSTAEIRAPLSAPIVLPRITGLKVGGALTAGGSSFTGNLDELQFFTLAPGAVFSPQAELAPSAQPELRVQNSPPLVPDVMVGRSMTFYVEITNVGSGMAAITPQWFTGDGSADYLLHWSGAGTWQDGLSGAQTTHTLAPGERWLLQVAFIPRVVGPRPAMLRLLTNDPQRPEIELGFSGVGAEAQPRLVVGQSRTQETDRVSFGRVLQGSSASTNIFIGNAGGLNLTGLSARVVGPQVDRFQISSFMTYTYVHGISNTVDPLVPGMQVYALLTYTPDATDIDTAWLEITSNDPAEPVKRLLLSGRGIPPTPDIQVSIADQNMSTGMTVDFGAADQGMTNNGKYLGISNPGTGPLNISDLRFEGAHAGDFTLRYPAVYAGSVLNAGEGRPTGIIEFTPSAVGQRSARLVIESDDPDESPFVIDLTGEGLPPTPEIAVLDGSRELISGHALVHVGHATPGGPRVSRQLTIRNDGGAPLTGLTATFEGRNASAFSPSILTSTLAPNTDASLDIRFTASDLGPHGATLVIISNDADEARYEIQLGGTGANGTDSLLRPDLPNWTTTAMAEASDGTLLLAGYTTIAASKNHQIRRIAKDGSELTSKVLTQFPNGEITALALQPDGRALIVGDFTQVGLAKRQGIARLNRDGTLDATFTPPTGGFRGRDVLVLPTGKIMLAGSGSLGAQKNLIRLNANGTLDTSFTLVSPNASVNALALEADGSVLFGGEYTNAVEMLATGGNSQFFSDGDLRRIKPDGKLDPVFGFGRRIYDIVIQGEDIYVAHLETRMLITITNTTFVQFLGPVFSRNASFSLGSDARTLTSSDSAPSFGPNDSYSYTDTLTRLSRSGSVLAQQTLDSFTTTAECLPRTLAFQPGGGLLVAPGPRFWNSPDLQQISRYRRDTLAVDAGFYAILGQPADVRAMHVQADGKVLVGGQFTGVNAWSGGYIGMPPPPTTGQPGNGNGGPALGFAQLSHEGNFRPDLRVKEQASGTALSDELSTLEMNAGSSAETTVKLDVSSILNLQPAYPSTAPTNLVIEIEGDHAADFTAEVSHTPPASHIYWNDVEITLRFRPSTSGLRTARLRLSLESMTRYGYAQNVFELNLRGLSGPVAPLTNLSLMQGQALTQQLADASLYDRFEATGLPPGIMLNPATGQISGSATMPGTYVVKVRARDRVTGVFTSFTLTLQIMPNQLAGQYFGLLERRPDALNGRGGLLSLVVTANGSWTATLQANLVPAKTTTQRFTGTLNVISATEASGVGIATQKGLQPLALAFEIRQGALSIFLDESLVGEGGRALTQSSLVGACHLTLLPDAGVPERLAVGFARANFTAKGIVTIAGKFTHAVVPEVRLLTQSTTWITGAASSSRVPFYMSLAQGETVSGWLMPEAGSPTLLTSTQAGCTVPASPYQDSATMTHWKAGDAAMAIRGGLWTPPARGTRLLGAGTQVPNARITVSQLTQDFTLTSTHQARPPGNAWPRPERGGVVQNLTVSSAGTFTGWTWFVFGRQGLVAPASANIAFGMFDGLFIPGLDQGIGLFQSIESAPTGRYPATTPGVIIQALK